MRMITRHQSPDWLEEGVSVDGYVAERALHDHQGAEVRYAVRAPDGREATLVTSRRPYGDRGDRARFRRLARQRAELDHPVLLRVRAMTERFNHPVLITDPYPECTFGDLLRHDAPLDRARVVHMLEPVCAALDIALASGLVHQTLSGDSLLLVGQDALLLDTFGVLSGEAPAWSTVQAGDLSYQPPEQVRGEPLGKGAAVYTVTALVVHALTGAPPYTGDRLATGYSHLADPPPRPSERIPELGSRIDAVVARGMAKEEWERPASACELIGEVAAALGVRGLAVFPRKLRLVPDRPAVAAAGGGMEHRRAYGRRGRGIAALAGAVGVAAACGALIAAAASPFGDDEPAASPRPVTPAAWSRLEEQRPALRDDLAEARTPSTQAAAAGDLAGLYSRAARAGPPALVTEARDAASAYTRLAAAAQNGDGEGWEAAARAAHESEARLALAASRH